MSDTKKITDKERATWSCVIITNGRRGVNRKELMVGYVGPRKNNECLVALCTGEVLGWYHVTELRGRRLGVLFFAYLNGRGLTIKSPNEDERGRRYGR